MTHRCSMHTAVGVFATYPPFDRNDVLDKTAEALGNNDVSLRERAQLLDFYRKLKFANYRLRRAGRLWTSPQR